MARVWVSVGSNQDRERCISGAVRALRRRFGTLTVSPVYESEAVGFEGAPFLNLVVGFDTGEGVASLNRALREIEDAFGRVRTAEKFSPRTLDLDLLTYGDAVGTVDGYELPRDEILRYAFVLRPMADAAGDELHPVEGRGYRGLWDDFDAGSQPMRRVEMDLEG